LLDDRDRGGRMTANPFCDSSYSAVPEVGASVAVRTEDRIMSRLIVIAALALGAAVTQQAIACDFQREANTTPVIVAEGCGGASCVTEQPTTSEPTRPTTQEPKQKIADEPASAVPVIVADGNGSH